MINWLCKTIEPIGTKKQNFVDKYPVDTLDDIKSAWASLHDSNSSTKYSAIKQAEIKEKLLNLIKQYANNPINTAKEFCQDRMWVADSYQEKCRSVAEAFYAWVFDGCPGISMDTSTVEFMYSACIIGITDSNVYTESFNWVTGGYEYFSIAYSGESTISFDSITKVDVALVVKSLEEQGKSMDKDEKSQAGDAVVDDKIVETASPVEFSDGNPDVEKPITEAETEGSSVEDPATTANSDIGVEHAGDEGASESADDNSNETEPTGEMAKKEAGVKQTITPDTNKPLLQGNAFDKAGTPLSYISQSSVEKDSNGKPVKMLISGIATRADIINAMGQVYPKSVWEKNLPYMNEQAELGKFLGKIEHPKDDEKQGLASTAIKFEKFWMEDSDVHFQALVIPTQEGMDLMAMLDSNIAVDISSRGYGTAVDGKWRGQSVQIVQDDFVCVGFDAVLHGASTGSKITDVTPVYQSVSEEKQAMETETMEKSVNKAEAIVQSTQLEAVRSKLITDASETLSDVGIKAYEQSLSKADSIEKLIEISETALGVLAETFPKSSEAINQGVTTSPSAYVQKAAENAPQTVSDMIDFFVRDLPDHYEQHDSNAPINHFNSPREACRKIMQNIANESAGTFNGRSAALSCLAWLQGRQDRAIDIMSQSLPTGATVSGNNANNDGAPLSAPLIFPLVRRVFPRYIMNEICAIQPLDRPQGKIFYLDTYRTEDPAGFEKRIDLNTSANPFNSSYANNPTEGSAAQQIRLRLSSVTVDAYTKKLGATWSIEQMQDLRAYHNLDSAEELIGSVAREMALEWNKTVLDDMLAQATGAALTFGTTAPTTGFTNQKDWDEYIWVYIQKLDNAIFSKRNGPITHLIAGVDAALALAKSMRGTFAIGGENGGDMGEFYPGTSFFGTVNAPNGSKYKVFKTNFWGPGTTNGSKILALRRGTEWSDTPYVWSPYTDYVTPLLTDPADFSQKQGIMSRAAHKVVVSDAIGYLTVDNSQGVVL